MRKVSQKSKAGSRDSEIQAEGLRVNLFDKSVQGILNDIVHTFTFLFERYAAKIASFSSFAMVVGLRRSCRPAPFCFRVDWDSTRTYFHKFCSSRYNSAKTCYRSQPSGISESPVVSISPNKNHLQERHLYLPLFRLLSTGAGTNLKPSVLAPSRVVQLKSKRSDGKK